jgi:hypothetical protein
MPDDKETECNLVTILSLRTQKERSKSAYKDLSDRDTTIIQRKRAYLPDAIIREGILSFRPFRSFRVLLIRGNNNSLGGLPSKHEYSLTFGSNRGSIRYLVVELPYLPNHEADAETYKAADGVIISCYISRFFEFCDRYGYNYASSSILQDVKARRAQGQSRIVQQQEQPDPKRRKTIGRPAIVLCGNNVDVTHVDARLSSIVFTESISMGAQIPSSINESGGATVSTRHMPSKSFIEAPRHPFSSLTRILTNDDGLEFNNISAGPTDGAISKETLDSYKLPVSKQEGKYSRSNDDDNPRNWNWLRAQVSS